MSIYPNNGPFTDSIESDFYFHLCAYLNWLEFFFNYVPHIIFAQTKLFSNLKIPAVLKREASYLAPSRNAVVHLIPGALTSGGPPGDGEGDTIAGKGHGDPMKKLKSGG